MEKIQQKIWFGISSVLFILPELLWNPVLNVYSQLFQTSLTSNTSPFRDSFLQNSENIFYLKVVIFLQLIGIFSFLFNLIKNKVIKNNILNVLFIIISIILVILTFFAFYITVSLNIEVL